MAIPTQMVILTGFFNPATRNNQSVVAGGIAEASFLQPEGMNKTRSHKRKRSNNQRKKELVRQENQLQEQSGGVEGNKFKHQGKRRRWVRDLSRLSAWYMASSISYILRKARAFYNELCCENYDDSFQGNEAMLIANPYFSVPVIPPPNIAPPIM